MAALLVLVSAVAALSALVPAQDATEFSMADLLDAQAETPLPLGSVGSVDDEYLWWWITAGVGVLAVAVVLWWWHQRRLLTRQLARARQAFGAPEPAESILDEIEPPSFDALGGGTGAPEPPPPTIVDEMVDPDNVPDTFRRGPDSVQE